VRTSELTEETVARVINRPIAAGATKRTAMLQTHNQNFREI